MILNGYLELRSVGKVEKEPAVYSIGGFVAISADGREYQFTWRETSDAAWFKDGKLNMDSEVSCFFESYFKEANSEVTLDELTLEFLTASTLIDVSYDCFSDEAEEKFILMEIVSFTVSNENNQMSFSKEKLAEINAIIIDEYSECSK